MRYSIVWYFAKLLFSLLRTPARKRGRQLADVLDVFEQEYGKTFSLPTRLLIHLTFFALYTDPHPRWRTTPDEAVRAEAMALENLPDILRNLIEQEHIQTRITYFDVLHFISKNLNQLCGTIGISKD